MMYYTHLAFGLLASLLYLYFLSASYDISFILITVFFSIFPDIDESRSKIGRKNKLISIPLNFICGHRGLLHTIYLPTFLFLIFYNINSKISTAILLGYTSHLFMDASTRHGIRPLSPLIRARIYGFVKTNSIFEKLFFLLIMALDIYLIAQAFDI